MIEVLTIRNESVHDLIKKYDESLAALKQAPFHIQSIYSLTKYLERLLKSIDPSSILELKERIEFNSELEKKLQQQGYSENLIENNPKKLLCQIAESLINDNSKAKALYELIISKNEKRIPTIMITNNNDVEFINENIQFNQLRYFETIQYSQLESFIKCNDPNRYTFVDTSLEGYNDFLKYYNFNFKITLLFYQHEHELYLNYLSLYQKELEKELTSPFRESFSGIKYHPISQPIDVKPLSSIIQEIVNHGNSYKDEDEFRASKENPDLDLPEVIHFIIAYENQESYWDELDSNDFVFNEYNRLLKVSRIRVRDKIRVYNERLNINLFDIASEEDEETFIKIEYFSDLWNRALLDYHTLTQISIKELHLRLSLFGLSVQLTTLQNYLDKRVRFPLRKSDLNAIAQLTRNEELISKFHEVLKYKRIYNGVMIALGKNLKEEICTYLKTKKLGDILKGSFTSEMLASFIETSMPLRIVKSISKQIIIEEL